MLINFFFLKQPLQCTWRLRKKKTERKKKKGITSFNLGMKARLTCKCSRYDALWNSIDLSPKPVDHHQGYLVSQLCSNRKMKCYFFFFSCPVVPFSIKFRVVPVGQGSCMDYTFLHAFCCLCYCVNQLVVGRSILRANTMEMSITSNWLTFFFTYTQVDERICMKKKKSSSTMINLQYNSYIPTIFPNNM